ncbi:ABC transporter permease [Acidobacteriota bacterium]
MKKILSIIKREYIQIVRTKGFIIGTVLGPVLMASLIVIPVLLAFISVDKQETIGVIDNSGIVYQELASTLDDTLSGGEARYVFREFKPASDPQRLREELNRMILDKELTAYLVIPDDVVEGGSAEYYSEHVSDFDQIKYINQAVNGIVIGKRLKEEGLDPQKIAEYMRQVELKSHKVTKKGVEEDRGETFAVAYFLVFILYMTLFFYGSIILRGVLEEKTNRVVEIILSSLRPFQLMMGKIFGIATVGFTQYAIWALFGIAITKFGGGLIGGIFPSAQGIDLPSIPPYIFIYFIVFFVLGYFLYGTIYAAVGSMVNSEKEAQQLIMPISMFLIIPILLVMFVMRSPDSTLSVVLSMIPFFAPILMLLRISILLPPFTQVAGSILIMILSILFMIWLVAKIYRVGILMYGKRPTFREIVKWVRSS